MMNISFNMIGAKLNDQRNSKHVDRFKFTVKCSNFPWQSTAVQNHASQARCGVVEIRNVAELLSLY